jgi:hypothetical protein
MKKMKGLKMKKWTGIRIFFVFLTALSSGPIFSDDISCEKSTDGRASSLFSVEDMRDDLKQLWKSLRENHPALYVFTKEDEFMELYQRQREKITQPLDMGGFYAIAGPLVAAVGCGHSILRAPKGYRDEAGSVYFPLEMIFLKEKAHSLRTCGTDNSIPGGAEILSINGLDIEDIKKTFYSLLSSDGSMDSGKRFRLGKRFASLFAHCFGFHNNFSVTYRALGENTVCRTVLKAADFKTIRIFLENRNRGGSSVPDPDLDFKILDGRDAALMTIKTFAHYRERERFYSFVDSAFKGIHEKKVGNLIIDLRDNMGGDPFCTTHLLSYIQSEPVRYFARVYPDYEKFAEPIPMAETPFKGRLFILINEGGFSSTGHLCGVLKSHKIGTFIGSETGATYTCNDATTQIILERTGLRLFVARMTFEAAAEGLPRNRGILPDFPVEAVIGDMAKGKDTVLEYTLEYIDKDNRK